jgi:carnitine O-acetyltransferase
MSSKHLQTRRLLNTLQAYLLEVRLILVQLWKEANEKPEAFMDHAGVWRDARTGEAITGSGEDEEDEMCESGELGASCQNRSLISGGLVSGFGFFDVGAQEVAPQSKRRRPPIGKTLSIAEY